MNDLHGLNPEHGFRQYFRLVEADSAELQADVFRVRHEVYCEELGFEPARDNGMEQDEYDAHSLHCLLQRVTSGGEPVGCARLVLPRPGQPEYPLPFERSCDTALDRTIIDPKKLHRDGIAEISRLAVRPAFRRRKGEEGHAVDLQTRDFGTKDQPRFPYIPISLYLGAVALAKRKGINTLFILTEPRLASHFMQLGVEVKQIGAPVSHRGIRIPSVMHVDEIEQNMRRILRPMWKVVNEELQRGAESEPVSVA